MRLWAACVILSALLISAPANAGNVPKAFELGMNALSKGDYAEAYCHWMPLAERGYADAQYHIGWLYANGNGLAVDIERALGWWIEAANQGHSDAQFAVGLAYTTGEGMKKDLNEAVNWYLTAARRGHQDARDILIRLNGDPSLDLLEKHPEVAQESWFGRHAKIRSDGINVRAGPGTNHKIVTRLQKDAKVRVIGSRGDWYMVVLPSSEDGRIAWIYKSLVSGTGR